MSAAGRCLCGHYRFQTQGNPVWVAYCHCESCRRATGAPIATFVGYLAEQVSFDPPPPQFASSAAVLRASCERCGTALSYQAEFYPGQIHLYRSNFDQPALFPATRHVLFDEREADFDLYDDLPRYGSKGAAPIAWGRKPAFRVLFLCTGNSARSILAEGILNLQQASLSDRRVIAHSAGSRPKGTVRPQAMELLRPVLWRCDHPRSKSWDEFCSDQAPEIDWAITLCDGAAAETCPVFPGKAQRLHWSLPDPVREGSADEEAQLFQQTWQAIEERVGALLDDLGVTRTIRSPLAPH